MQVMLSVIHVDVGWGKCSRFTCDAAKLRMQHEGIVQLQDLMCRVLIVVDVPSLKRNIHRRYDPWPSTTSHRFFHLGLLAMAAAGRSISDRALKRGSYMGASVLRP